MVNYWFDTFKHLKSFDILPYQEVVDLYLKNQSLLDKSGKEKLGGDNERPINSDKEEVDENAFWLGQQGRYAVSVRSRCMVGNDSDHARPG